MQRPGFGGRRLNDIFHVLCWKGEWKKLCINALPNYSYKIECVFLALATLGATENIQYG